MASMTTKKGNCVYPELEKFIERRGLTQAEFAEKIGINTSSANKFLNGKQFLSHEGLENVVKFTGLSYVFGPDGNGDFKDLSNVANGTCETSEQIDIPVKPVVNEELIKDVANTTADLVIKEAIEALSKMTTGSYSFSEYQEAVKSVGNVTKQYAYMTLNSYVGFVNDMMRELIYGNTEPSKKKIMLNLEGLLGSITMLCNVFGVSLAEIAKTGAEATKVEKELRAG